MFVHTEICDHCKKEVSSRDIENDYQTSGLRLARYKGVTGVEREYVDLPDGYGTLFEVNKPTSFHVSETVLNSCGSSSKSMYFTVPGVVCSTFCFEQFIMLQLQKLMSEASKANDPK